MNPEILQKNERLQVVDEKLHYVWHCKNCPKTFETKETLKNHKENQCYADDRLLNCDECKDKFNDKLSLMMHKQTHAKIRNIPCTKCDVKFSSKYYLYLHQQSIHKQGSNPFPCYICNETFTYKLDRSAHIKSKHGDINSYYCYKCEKSFKSRNELKNHKKTTCKTYDCNLCDMKFSENSHLKKHVRNNHMNGKPHKCEFCEERFVKKCELLVHERIHGKEKVFQCEICLKRYSSRKSLKCHQQVHTGKPLPTCKVCNCTFLIKSQLAKHEITHTEGKPFKCDICPKRYTTKFHLQEHMRVHLKDKSFQCEYCGKIFPYKQSLKVHVRSHTGEKPYSCPLCNLRFSNSRPYKNHKKRCTDTKKVRLGDHNDNDTNCPSDDHKIASTLVTNFSSGDDSSVIQFEVVVSDTNTISMPQKIEIKANKCSKKISPTDNQETLNDGCVSTEENSSQNQCQQSEVMLSLAKLLQNFSENICKPDYEHTCTQVTRINVGKNVDTNCEELQSNLMKSLDQTFKCVHKGFETTTVSDKIVDLEKVLKVSTNSEIVLESGNILQNTELESPKLQTIGETLVEDLIVVINDKDVRNSYEEKDVIAEIKDISNIKSTVSSEGHTVSENNDKVCICRYCKSVFQNRYRLNQHNATCQCHGGKKIKCQECKETFPSFYFLNKHVKLNHVGVKAFTCDKCGESFIERKDFNIHIHNCMKMNVPSQLKSHVTLKEGEDQSYVSVYLCKICNKHFMYRKQLLEHEEKHLPPAKTSKTSEIFECEECSKVFENRRRMKWHQRLHKYGRPYVCKICGRKFVEKCTLVHHEKIHEEGLPHQCNLCPKRFDTIGHLKEHFLVHSKEKSYQCETCGKMFGLMRTLKRHVRVHTGEKPYQCSICKRRFPDAGKVRSHQKRIHTEHTDACVLKVDDNIDAEAETEVVLNRTCDETVFVSELIEVVPNC
ncbi:uncharacterized protein [Antedon mediterranea]